MFFYFSCWMMGQSNVQKAGNRWQWERSVRSRGYPAEETQWLATFYSEISSGANPNVCTELFETSTQEIRQLLLSEETCILLLTQMQRQDKFFSTLWQKWLNLTMTMLAAEGCFEQSWYKWSSLSCCACFTFFNFTSGQWTGLFQIRF